MTILYFIQLIRHKRIESPRNLFHTGCGSYGEIFLEHGKGRE